MQMAIHRSSSHADPHERPFITSPPDCSFAQNTVSAAPTHLFGTTIDAVKRIIQRRRSTDHSRRHLVFGLVGWTL